MKNKILSFFAAVAVVLTTTASMAANSADKPISKVSDVNNMSDDSMVYIQGFITQVLGDEKYTFQDDSGTITVEIDDELMENSAISPTTMVWIAAEVDKKGNIVELEAEEIQFMPETMAVNTSASNQ